MPKKLDHPFDQLLDPKTWDKDRFKVINEAVFRSPAAIQPLSQITHIPLIHRSAEDFVFTFVSEDLGARLDDPVSPSTLDEFAEPKGLLSILHGRLSLATNWRRLCPDDAIKSDQDRSRSFEDAALEIDRTFSDLLETHPEYLIFGCYSQIIRVTLNNLLKAKLKLDDDYRVLLTWLHRLMFDNFNTLAEFISKRILEAHRVLESEYRPNMGGIIAVFETIDGSINRTVHRSSRTTQINPTFEDDHLDLDLLTKDDDRARPGQFFRLKWYRSNQFWNYTFFESPVYLSPLSPLLPTELEVPNLPLAQQSTNIKSLYRDALAPFFAALLIFGENPSTLRNPALRRKVSEANPDHDMRFPGDLLAGAHYMFLPVSALLSVVFYPEQTFEMAQQHISNVRKFTPVQQNRLGKDFEHLKNHFISVLKQSVDRHASQYEELQGFLKSIGYNKGSWTDWIDHSEFFDIGGKLWSLISASDTAAARLGQLLAMATSHLWTAISLAESRSHHEMDFISCFVVDRKAVYFANFQPEGDDHFTRTFFVDLDLNGFQRSRLGQRLCDIATYRSMCVRDANRVKSVVRGLDEFERQINILNERNEGEAVKRLDSIQERLDEMNSLLVYGIRGRYLSANAYLSQIRERTDDIREERIWGFPVLSDFLERRVASAVRDIERMAERYDYLRSRVRDSYSRIRTSLNALETSRISGFLEASMGLIDQLRETADESRKLQQDFVEVTREHVAISQRMSATAEHQNTLSESLITVANAQNENSARLATSAEKQNTITSHINEVAERAQEIEGNVAKSLERQLAITSAADVLVYVAGTYYVYSLIEHVGIDLNELGWQGKSIVLVGIVAAIKLGRWVFKKIVETSSS